MIGHGWALPRWVMWVLIALGTLQTAVGQSGFKLIDLHWHSYDLTAVINTALTFAAAFVHSQSIGGLRLPPWMGNVSAFLATAATMGLPPQVAAFVSLLGFWIGSISRSVTSTVPVPSPESAMVATVVPSTPKSAVQGGGVA